MKLLPCLLKPLYLLLAIGALFAPAPAIAATTCTASMTNLSFGTVDPFGAQVDATASLSYSCTVSAGLRRSNIRLCLSIGGGSGGAAVLNPRLMPGGATSLEFQIYKDAARTSLWGHRDIDANHVALALTVQSSALAAATVSGTLPVYGRVFGDQSALTPASYSSSFGVDTQWRFRANETLVTSSTTYPSDCASGGNAGNNGNFPFTATAEVESHCAPGFAANDLDFGTRSALTSAIDTATTLTPRCTNTTAYQIGLDNGANASGQMRRMRSSGGQFVNYELYRDDSRTQRWGNSSGSDTVPASGTGSPQTVTIHGRVPPQTVPPAALYSDRITVTLTY